MQLQPDILAKFEGVYCKFGDLALILSSCFSAFAHAHGLCSINTIQLLYPSCWVLHPQWKRVSQLIWNSVPHIGSGLENLTDSSLSTKIHKVFLQRWCWGWTTVPCQLIWKAKVKRKETWHLFFECTSVSLHLNLHFSLDLDHHRDLDLLHLNLHFGYTMTSTMKLILSSSTMKPSATLTSWQSI